MKTDLLVIDVQDYFPTAATVVDETIREIKLAKRRSASIIVAEYGPKQRCGKTNQKVLAALKGYNKAIFITKTNDGGGKEVMKACTRNGVHPTKFRVVGVNRSFCVAETLCQIFDIFRYDSKKVKIEVSEKGTHCEHPRTGLANLERMGCYII